MHALILLDAVLFAVIATLASTLRGSFDRQPCVRLEQPCACQNRKRDERGRFSR